MKINATKVVQVEAKTLKIHMKCRDTFDAQLVDQDGGVLKDYEGYVPGFMPGKHYGDYLMLDIDLDSGKILNWETPEAEEIEEFVKGCEE